MHLKMQTLAMAYEELASEQEDFRVAVGNFMNAFFLYAVESRQELIDPLIPLPEDPTEHQRRWAAFCAGAAEYLAERYDLTCPGWVHRSIYLLSEPWYMLPLNSEMQEEYRASTPQAFRKRNVFCSDRVFTNPHPSSREPGSFMDRQLKRAEILATISPQEREAYLVAHTQKMQGKPRVHIVA